MPTETKTRTKIDLAESKTAKVANFRSEELRTGRSASARNERTG